MESDLVLEWDPESLDITSKAVEKILEPLLHQVSNLVNYSDLKNRKKGQSKQGDTILNAIQEMIKDFLSRGEEILLEAPDRKRDFKAALGDVERTGKDLYKVSEAFLNDSCNTEKRTQMISAVRAMLSAVTRLMILADIVDVYLLLRTAREVESCIKSLSDSSDLQNLVENWKKFGVNVCELIDLAGIRQRDLIDDRKKYEIAAARGILKLQTPMLLTTSKAYIRHPELASAKANRDFVIKSVCDAVEMINTANKGSGTGKLLFYEKPGELATALDDFDKCAIMKLENFNETEASNLTAWINRILKDSNVLASSPCTREKHAQGIINNGREVENSFKQLIATYRKCLKGSLTSNDLRASQSKMLQNTERLRIDLKRAVADHVSDVFIDIQEPLKILVNAAKSGNEDQVESVGPYFLDTVGKLVEVANLACSVSTNHEGLKVVRLSANQVEQLCPQVINAARVLVLRPSSKFAQENMEVFKTTFASCLATLSDAVDNITNIWDYLVVMDGHVNEDIKDCIKTAKIEKLDEFTQNITMLKSRLTRVCEAVHGEMENFKKSEYRTRIEENLADLERQTMPELNKVVQSYIQKLKRGEQVNESHLRDIFNEVYDGVHEIWKAVVFGRDQSGYETDVFEEIDNQRNSNASRSSSDLDLSAVAQEDQIIHLNQMKSERAVMKILSGQNKEIIDREMAGFFEQRKRLMHEMTKWDETANDIVVLAKKMCVIMMDMTDFTRGKGPLKTTMDVIEVASKISECGNQLNNVASQIASQCPNSAHKSDLEKYMERVTLYCHQLKITSRVKADVQSVSGEIVISGLDSVTSLIESSKNLMAAVVETVKASYIASTKYKSTTQKPIVQWKMKAPKKKPLVQNERSKENEMRKSQNYIKTNPTDELAQFDR